MRVVVTGAGAVGRHLAADLAGRGHEVVLIELNRETIDAVREELDGVELQLGDACEPWVLEDARLSEADVVVAATGDDEDNLVTSLLARTEFAVPRVLARVNHPKNQWLFNDQWGVDQAVSPPHILTALVEDVYRRVQLPTPWVEQLTAEMEADIASAGPGAWSGERRSRRSSRRSHTTVRKLLRAFYGNAIPIELLKSEQDRLTGEERAAKQELDVAETDISGWEDVLRTAITLAGNCHAATLHSGGARGGLRQGPELSGTPSALAAGW